MKLHVSSHLTQYTGGRTAFDVAGSTMDEALRDFDRQFPGVRFRFIDEQGCVREHFNLFLNRQKCHDLAAPLAPGSEIHVIAALSGG